MNIFSVKTLGNRQCFICLPTSCTNRWYFVKMTMSDTKIYNVFYVGFYLRKTCFSHPDIL